MPPETYKLELCICLAFPLSSAWGYVVQMLYIWKTGSCVCHPCWLYLFSFICECKTFTSFQKSAQRNISASIPFLQSFHSIPTRTPSNYPFSFWLIFPFFLFAQMSKHMQIFLFPLFSYTKGNILDMLFCTLLSFLRKEIFLILSYGCRQPHCGEILEFIQRSCCMGS